jgi:SAM-dependent methyltransferase
VAPRRKSMDNSDSGALWDQKYAQGLPSLTKPDPFFLSAYESFVQPLFPRAGVALDLAGGLGRHALWLATRNWRVTVVDVSSVAIGKLSQAADQRTLTLNLFVADAAEHEFGFAGFDLIVLFYHFDRGLFPKIVSALSPGGIVICKMAVRWGSGIGAKTNEENPLARNELVSLFPDLHVIDYEERPIRDRGVVKFVGRKPVA